MEIVTWILIAGIIASSLSSVYHSFRSRRSINLRNRGLYAARMNISMGTMLILIAAIQIMLFEGDTLRVIFGTIFLLLGAFNLFAGLRNHGIYSRVQQ